MPDPKPLSRLATPVLFLDFDGVLHQADEPTIGGNGEFIANERLFCWREHLEALLQAYPAVQIVVSSDWRKYHTEEDLATFLGDDLGQRLLGIMPIVEKGSRAEAVHAEAARLGLRHWLALDDHQSFHEARQRGDDRFLACHPEQGLDCRSIRHETASKLRWLSWLAKHNSVSVLPVQDFDFIQDQAPCFNLVA